MSTPYDDIINMPHHVSPTRPRMSQLNRAAQFSPFAALTGYEAEVEEAARLTEQRIELDEGEKEVISQRLLLVQERLPEPTEVTISCFVSDKKKNGGAYVSVSGTVKKIDSYEQTVILLDGAKIPLDAILHIDSTLFDRTETNGIYSVGV